MNRGESVPRNGVIGYPVLDTILLFTEYSALQRHGTGLLSQRGLNVDLPQHHIFASSRQVSLN